MSKNILIFCANPNPDSFCLALAQAYEKGAIDSQAKTKLYNLIDLNFDLNLTRENKYGQNMEPQLLTIQQEIKQAEHLVFVYPNWWGTFPALLKGFIDRVFIKGFAYDFKNNNPIRTPLLQNKTARIIVTMDTPKWYYKWIYHSPGHYAMKKSTLEFCGIKPVKTTFFSPMKNTSEKQRQKYLSIANELGRKQI